MAMHLQQLECLDAVVRHGTMKAAADSLSVSRISVSIQISRLERELGVQLLVRSSKGSTLSAAGQELLPHIRAVLRSQQALQRHAEGAAHGRSGVLRVAGINTAVIGFLPAAIRRVQIQFPDVEVLLSELSAPGVANGLYDGAFDLGVAGGHRSNLGTPPAGLEVEVLFESPLVFVSRGDHPLQKAPEITREMVAAEPLVALGRGHNLRTILEDYMDDEDLSIVCDVLTNDTARRMIGAGLGVSVMPDMNHRLGQSIADDIQAKPLADCEETLEFWLIHKGDAASPAGKAMADAIRTESAAAYAAYTSDVLILS